jgi:hypothetical protein
MLRKLFLTAVLFKCFIFASIAQSVANDLVTTALHRHSLLRGDSVYLFYAVHPSKKIKPRSSKLYYWYKGDTILVTEGAFDGWVLNGSYKIFYPNKNIKQSGQFTNGLKTGIWRSWFPDGTLRNIVTWKNGERTGFFEEHHNDGSLSEKGHYRKNQISGIMTEYNSDGKKTKVKYKDGVQVRKKKKGKKDSTSKQ